MHHHHAYQQSNNSSGNHFLQRMPAQYHPGPANRRCEQKYYDSHRVIYGHDQKRKIDIQRYVHGAFDPEINDLQDEQEYQAKKHALPQM